MDIEARLNLRSFIKPDSAPIFKAILGALLIHLLLGINWQLNNNSTVAEIPEWVNVKLIAGFELEDKKTDKKQVQTKKEIIKKTNPSSIKKEKIVKEIKKSSSASPTTFVKADSRPYKLDNAKPVYPAAARRRGMQGTVYLSVIVNKSGNVELVKVMRTSGFRVLDRSALKSVQTWRFIPAKNNGENVSSTIEVPIRFILNDV